MDVPFYEIAEAMSEICQKQKVKRCYLHFGPKGFVFTVEFEDGEKKNGE